MKRYAVLLALALLWGCNERATGPSSPDVENDPVTYGSSVIKLPALPLAKLAAGSVSYKFILTISGDGMDPMTFSWPVDGSGDTFTIDRIPAGRSRLFSGQLYSENGVNYEGSAYADIVGGKVAYVSLVLRKTGSAQVEVIFEDGGGNNDLEGCFGVEGRINEIDLFGLTIEILSSDTNTNEFWAYFKKDEEVVGKFWGTVSGTRMTAEIHIEENNTEGRFNGYITDDRTAFKGEITSLYDTSVIGFLSGYTIDCTEVPEPECEYDTLGIPGTGTCEDTATWIAMAEKVCRSKNKQLTDFHFYFNCDEADPAYFETICFECCATKK